MRPVESGRSAEELRKRLEELGGREDYEACLTRARIYRRLRVMEEPDAWDLVARGDAADVGVLSQAAPAEYKAESAGRLFRHFRERAQDPALRRSRLEGPALCGPLHRAVLSWIAAMFSDYLGVEERSEALAHLGEDLKGLAGAPGLRGAMRAELEARAVEWSRRGAELRAGVASAEPDRRARRFCELDLGRHLEEATRAADQGAREKVARGEEGRVVDWYLEALGHFVLARECLAEPTPAQENALGMMDVVVRILADLLCREP